MLRLGGGHKTWTSVNKNIDALTGLLEAYRPTDSARSASNIQQVVLFGKLFPQAQLRSQSVQSFFFFNWISTGTPLSQHYFLGKRGFYLKLGCLAKQQLGLLTGTYPKMCECHKKKLHQICQHCFTTHSKLIVLPSRRWLLL